MAADTIVHRLFAQARQRPDSPAYADKRGGVWRVTSWREHAAEVRRAAKAMIALGFEAGRAVTILGFNRPEWLVFDLAAMAAGGAPAGIYTTSSAEEVRYVVAHAEAPLVLVENQAQWDKIRQRAGELPALRHVVTMRGCPAIDHPLVLGWDAFLAKGDGVDDARLDARVDALEPGGLATLIYTSGTTGPPKGVMLSHDNLAWTADVARGLLDVGHLDRSLSYLPMSHIAEQMFTIHLPTTSGASVFFAESIDKVGENLKEVEPTVFFGVPRIWEKMHAGITAKLGAATGAKKKIFAWARGVGARVAELSCRGERPTGMLALEHAAAERIVFSKLRKAVGFGSARAYASGAAPIAKEVLDFFASVGIVVLEVYGQSEDTGPTTFNRPGKTKLGTVGPAVPGVEVKLAEDGEILVRGRNVFMGYYKEPEATAEALKDGWLCSGDLGALDADGFLTITGRKKDILITAGGKNIAPKNIEAALKNHPLVGEAVVIGDRRKYLTALVALDPEEAARLAKSVGKEGTPPHELPEARAVIQKVVDEVNRDLARVETVKKFAILPRPLGIDTGELTPTLKVKRKAVSESFAAQIEELYRDA